MRRLLSDPVPNAGEPALPRGSAGWEAAAAWPDSPIDEDRCRCCIGADMCNAGRIDLDRQAATSLPLSRSTSIGHHQQGCRQCPELSCLSCARACSLVRGGALSKPNDLTIKVINSRDMTKMQQGRILKATRKLILCLILVAGERRGGVAVSAGQRGALWGACQRRRSRCLPHRGPDVASGATRGHLRDRRHLAGRHPNDTGFTVCRPVCGTQATLGQTAASVIAATPHCLC